MFIRPTIFTVPFFIIITIPDLAYAQIPELESEEITNANPTPVPAKAGRKKDTTEILTTDGLFEKMYEVNSGKVNTHPQSSFRYEQEKNFVKPKMDVLGLFDPDDDEAFWQLGHWGNVTNSENHLFQHKNFLKWRYVYRTEDGKEKVMVVILPVRAVKSMVKGKSKKPFIEFEIKW